MVRSLQVEKKFSEFYEEWIGQLEEHVALLLKAQIENSNNEICVAMVNKLMALHKEFYKAKWAYTYMLGLFNPIWFTSLENPYLWAIGWKPSMAFCLIESLKEELSGSSIAGMTQEQTDNIEALRAYIKVEEERVEREMERQQGRMADRNIVELSRLQSLAVDEEAVRRVEGLVEVAIGGLAGELEGVMKMGDCLRLKTMKGVLEVLNPMQGVEFLTATCTLQIKTREWIKNREKIICPSCNCFLEDM